MPVFRVTRLFTKSEHVFVKALWIAKAVRYVYENPNKVKWRSNNDASTAIFHRMEIEDPKEKLKDIKNVYIEYLNGTRVKLEDYKENITSQKYMKRQEIKSPGFLATDYENKEANIKVIYLRINQPIELPESINGWIVSDFGGDVNNGTFFIKLTKPKII